MAASVFVPRSMNSSSGMRSATQSSSGTFTSLTEAGTQSAVLHDRHTTRVQVPFGSGDYYLIVTQAPRGTNKATGSWVARIVVTSSACRQVRRSRLSTSNSSSAQTERKLDAMNWRSSWSEPVTGPGRRRFQHAGQPSH